LNTPALHILVLPALGIPSGYYRPLAEALAPALQAEVDVLSMPGPGNWAQRLSAAVLFGYPELVDMVCDRVRQQRAVHPQQAQLLLGHSLGGHAALVAASRLGDALAGIALVASGTPWWGAWPAQQQGRLKKMITAVDLISRCLPWYPGSIFGFGGDQPRRLMRHWSVLARTGVLANIPGLGLDAARFADVRLPVLAANLAGDDYAPSSATDHLLSAFPGLLPELVLLDPAWQRSLPAARRHVAWVRQPAEVVELVGEWARSMGFSRATLA
jgi:predicted alpha/beta hydrolase